MSFLLDLILLGLLILVVVIYSKQSIFSAAAGLVALTVASVGAILLTGPLSAPLNTHLMAPMVEQSVAGELADMYSAPHLNTGRDTVASLPLGDLVADPPEPYLQLLADYGVTPEQVATAYYAAPVPQSVLVAIASPLSSGLSQTIVLVTLTAIVFVLLRLVGRVVEQNLPPQHRYRGAKKLIPGAIGVAAGFGWSWVVATVIHWMAPMTAGMVLSLDMNTLQATDWYRFLWWSNPLLALFRLMG